MLPPLSFKSKQKISGHVNLISLLFILSQLGCMFNAQITGLNLEPSQSSNISNPTTLTPILSCGVGFSTTTSFIVSASWNGSVTDFDSSDITVKNGSISLFSGSGKDYSFTITPISEGPISVSVASGVALDSSGNTNAASNIISTYGDITPSYINFTTNGNLVNETDSTAAVSVAVTMSIPKPYPTTIYYSLDNTLGSSQYRALSGTDHDLPTLGTFVIPPNNTTSQLVFNIIGDNVVNPNTRYMILNINGSDKVTVSVGSTQTTWLGILDDEGGGDKWKIIKTSSLGSQRTVCGITFANKLKCWGSAANNQIPGYISFVPSPVPVDASSDYSQIAVGNDSVCGLTSSKIKCWGTNASGQLGDGTTTTNSTPTIIDSSTNYVSISGSFRSFCGITTTGVLKCWGLNGMGQIGIGSIVDQLSPAVVSSGTSFNIVQAGYTTTCAIDSTGVLRCWGNDMGFNVGNGASAIVTTPAIIDPGTTFSNVSQSLAGTCGIVATSGVLKCWGDLAVASPTIFDSGFSYLTSFSKGLPSTVLGILSNGTLRYGGIDIDQGTIYKSQITGDYYHSGILVDTTNSLTKTYAYSLEMLMRGELSDPTPISISESALSYSSSQTRTCFVAASGYLYCAQSLFTRACLDCDFGDNSTIRKAAPYIIDPGTLYSKISYAGSYDNSFLGAGLGCGITITGQLKCWGKAGTNFFGNGVPSSKLPTIIDSGTTYRQIRLTKFNSVDPSFISGCGITTEKKLKCWGKNTYGMIGNNSTIDVDVPTIIDNSTNYSKISIGLQHACAIVDVTGELKCWGRNESSQLGDGTTINKLVPTTIMSGTSFIEVAASAAHTCAISALGELYCWGAQTSGQLGNGINSAALVSTPAITDSGINYIKIENSGSANCGLTSAGQLKCWGTGSTMYLSSPVVLTPELKFSSSTFSSVQVNSQGICAQDAANNLMVKCWGNAIAASAPQWTNWSGSSSALAIDSATP